MARRKTIVRGGSGADRDHEACAPDEEEVLASAQAHARRKRNERATRKELEEPWRP